MAKLEPAFPASPSRPPKYVITFTRRSKISHDCSAAFCGTYAAKKFLDVVLEDEEYKWTDKCTIETVGGLKIKCEPNLEDIIEHELTADEEAWELPEPHASEAKSIATGVKMKISQPVESADRSTSKTTRKPAEARPDGLVTIQDICTELKLDPREARVILRKHVKKPDHGWAWPKNEVDAIKRTLTSKAKGGDNGGDKTPVKIADDKSAQTTKAKPGTADAKSGRRQPNDNAGPRRKSADDKARKKK